MLEATLSIAQNRDTERRTISDGILAKKIPAVPLCDLEGRLVEHSFSLCEHLEAELQPRGGNSRARQAVAAPRVAGVWINRRGGKGGSNGQTVVAAAPRLVSYCS